MFQWGSIKTQIGLWALASVLLMAGLGIYSIHQSSTYLTQTYGQQMASMAGVMLSELDKTIAAKVEQLMQLASLSSVHDPLARSNALYGQMADRKQVIQAIEKQWSQGQVNSLAMAGTVSHNPLARKMRRAFFTFSSRHTGREVYLETTLSNRYGATVATTHKQGDFGQAEQDWWKRAMAKGVHIHGVEYDPGTQEYGLLVAVRVDNADHEPLGVLKALLSTRWIMREALLTTKRSERTRIYLTTSQGKLLYATTPFNFFQDVSDRPFFGQASGKERSYQVQEAGTTRLYAQADSNQTKYLQHLDWKLFAARNVERIMAPMFRLKRNLGLVYMTVVGLSLVLAFFLARAVTRPIGRLQQAARAIGQGHMETRVPVRGGGEVSELAAAFNTMIQKIHTAHQALEQEVQEREAAQEALSQKNAELESTANELARSNSELQEFAYIASHDLQEPLRKISAFGDRLATKEADNLSARGQDYLRRIQNASQRMSQLIDDLLQYSRVTTKAKPFQPTDLNGVVTSVLEDLEESIQASGAEITVQDLPQVDADPVQMRQVFQNVLSNALKFIPPERKPRIRVWGQVEDDQARIEVADNGIGFDQKYLDRLFKPFQRLHGQNEYPGSGMGTAICEKIVSRHGGRITATSTPGEGSTFIIDLPLHPIAPDQG